MPQSHIISIATSPDPSPMMPNTTVQKFKLLVEEAKGCIENELWDDAIRNFKNAIALDCEIPIWVYLTLGSLLVQEGCIDDAIEQYKNALSLDPMHARCFVLLGTALEKKGLKSDAIDHYLKAIAINPEHPPWVYKKLGNFFRQRAIDDNRQSATYYAKSMILQDRFSNLGLLNECLQKTSVSGNRQFDMEVRELQKKLEDQNRSADFVRHLKSFGFLDSLNSPVNPTGYYLINKKLKIVYCSIPKNACTLFKTMMVENSELCDEFEVSNENIHIFVNEKAKKRSASFLLDCLDSPQYFKFVVLRNPFDRVVSAYLDKIAKHPIPEGFAQDVIRDVHLFLGLDPDIEKSITFSQFVDYLLRTPDPQLNDHWRPQYNFTANVKFDFVGRFDEMDKVIDSLENMFDISIRKNVSNHITNYQDFQMNSDFSNMLPSTLRKLKGLPTASLLCTDDLKQKVYLRYMNDFMLFEQNFSSNMR